MNPLCADAPVESVCMHSSGSLVYASGGNVVRIFDVLSGRPEPLAEVSFLSFNLSLSLSLSPSLYPSISASFVVVCLMLSVLSIFCVSVLFSLVILVISISSSFFQPSFLSLHHSQHFFFYNSSATIKKQSPAFA